MAYGSSIIGRYILIDFNLWQPFKLWQKCWSFFVYLKFSTMIRSRVVFWFSFLHLCFGSRNMVSKIGVVNMGDLYLAIVEKIDEFLHFGITLI